MTPTTCLHLPPPPLAAEHVSVAPRLCMLRRDEGEAYGFNLRVERTSRGHLVRKVVSRGAAERAGLCDGDRVLEVNGHFVDDASHDKVSELTPA